VWKKDGITSADLTSICNTDAAKIERTSRSAIDRLIPWLEMKEPHNGHVAIVAGAEHGRGHSPKSRGARASASKCGRSTGRELSCV
jgi:hypothetical protein